ncbi:MAG: dTMP kinase [Bacillota bacterium]|nr:dTMP kinase [Bacillota bacterium]
MAEKNANNKKGLFISIEGPDGAGKTTQARLLKSRLENFGLEVILTREPGGTPIGEEVRNLLLNPDFFEMTVPCEVLLYTAARAQLVSEFIRPSLQKGIIVISDRYMDSNLVYQGLAGGENPDVIKTINMWATDSLIPDITFLLDLEAETGLERLQKNENGAKWQGDRIEQRNLEFHQKVRQGFLQLASGEAARFMVINAGDGPHIVHKKIWEKTQLLLQNENLLS